MELVEVSDHDVEPVQPWVLDSAVESYGFGVTAADLKQAYKIRIGDRPFARSLRKLFQLKGQAVPPELAAINGEPYTLTHVIGVIATKKPKRIERIGLEIELHGDAFTVELFPNTSYAQFFSGGLQAGFEAGLSAGGYAKLPVPSVSAGVISLGGGAELRLGGQVSLVGNLRLKMGIQTPRIQTAGQASAHAVWQLDRDEKALVGDQTLLQTIIAAPGARQIECTATGFVVVDRWFQSSVRLQAAPVHTLIDLTSVELGDDALV